MKLQFVELSFSEMLALKQQSQEKKILLLRSMSAEERKDLNERSVDLCQKIAAEFGKSSRLVIS